MNSLNRHDAEQLRKAYEKEKPMLLSRLRAAGRSLEEAEDLVHDVFAETLERLPVLSEVRNLPGWINSLFKRRVIDAWRRRKMKASKGETEVAEETIRDIISGVGLDPLDGFVRQNLMAALDDAIKALPRDQRRIIEAQVFGGRTFREISEMTGESIDTLMARKRYAVQKLSKALRHWIDE